MTSRDSNFRSYNEVRELTAEEKRYAATYLNETDENRENSIAEIRCWISENERLRAPTDDFTILRFLRACKFNIEKTQLKIRNYHQHRADLPEWYNNRDPFLPEVQELLDLGIFLPLRKLDDQGRVVIFVRVIHDPYKQKISDFLKASAMIFDILARDNVPLSLRGIVVIIDMGNVSFGHALQMRPSFVKNLVNAWQGSYPIRIKLISFINVPMYINAILMIFKKFMNAKLRERLRAYSRGATNTCQDLPADILPVNYGGTDCTIQELKEYWKKRVEDNRNWFADNDY